MESQHLKNIKLLNEIWGMQYTKHSAVAESVLRLQNQKRL